MANYKQNYFDDEIFSTDYLLLAKFIIDEYKPNRIIEVGCGPGHLTKSLAKMVQSITAIDGFSSPDFSAFPNIKFSNLDLNREQEMTSFFKKTGKYDLVICTEVAEHLLPESSTFLIKNLTNLAPVLVFSAAIPGQNGNGHINCQPRIFWHNLLKKQGFILRDSLRSKMKNQHSLAIWYRLNVLDYVSEIGFDAKTLNTQSVIENLLENESNVTSLYYAQSDEIRKLQYYLNLTGIRHYIRLRNALKKILK